jgi:hypothetical protein
MKKSLFIASPAHDGRVEVAYLCAMLDVQQSFNGKGIPHTYYFNSGESLVPRARNNICKVFLNAVCQATKEPFTHLLMIDTDLGFGAADVLALFNAADDAHGIVAGLAPLKVLNWQRVADAAAAGIPVDDLPRMATRSVVNILGDYKYSENPSPIVPVKYVGTGFMIITRKALLDWASFHPDKRYIPDYKIGTPEFDQAEDPHVTAYFDTMICPEEGRYLSEDYTFCRRAREAGIETYVARDVRVSHIGKYTYLPELGGL